MLLSQRWIDEKLEMFRRIKVAPPLPNDTAGRLHVEGGILKGDGALYVPTGVKFYNRPSLFVGRPVAIMLHYTGCHASNRPLKDWDKIVGTADYRLDDTAGAIIDLKLMCEEIGYIPDAVSLCIQNAMRSRNASWCICVGSQTLPDGHLPVAQYSPNLSSCGTMNAGSPTQLWRARKKYGKKVYKTSRDEVRWDGKNYEWPEIELPDDSGNTLILSNVNSYVIGIEMMNLGPYGLAKRLKYPGLPKVKVGSRWYEQPSELMIETLKELISAIRAEYGDIPVWGHLDVTKGKIDPWPPFLEDL